MSGKFNAGKIKTKVYLSGYYIYLYIYESIER